MTRTAPDRALAAGAATVTVLLTAAAFWLSYEHLHDIADANGLDAERAWVWPATVDLFIIAGELLMLRAALRNRVDGWAIALAATGSLGSIALNVAGVGDGAQSMEYVVAAVPPTAALVAFGALMRQVHEALATARPAVEVASRPVVAVIRPVPQVVPAEARLLPVVARAVTALPPAVPVIRPVPEAVPAGVRLLPIISAKVTTPDEPPLPDEPPTVTLERLAPGSEQVVTRPVTVEAFRPIAWPADRLPLTTAALSKMTAAVPADEVRQVVTVPVTITPSELRKQARALNREVVRDTGRPVTIERLRDEYGLSRRDATELRRHVVDGVRS
ncbi:MULTISPECIES: DUF2637 domain-containing protein [Streptomyces]|uniref:DUF2637 domain-containing protein n=1 Tax=Streptomyces TaxID=1883 RepID=UPI0020621F94|nr:MULTISPECIES: DUF2637 domain-containing protein [Streptomyces]UPT41793.1 DUF2637 domain-containing protein [Streptomyces sp. WAC00303]WIY76026.1 DUF2637 domain-containing protein [Streptomyces anulatus]